MQIEKLVEQKEKISQKLARLEKKGQLLKVKERKIQTKRLIEAGTLIAKAQIDHLTLSALFGALLEIQDRSHDEATISHWQARGEAMLHRDKQEKEQRVILTFQLDLDEATKTSLKALRFRWNAFRQEWYGFGKKDDLEALFKAFGAKVEIAPLSFK